MRLLDGGDVENLRALLESHPDLSRRRIDYKHEKYFQNPALIEFIAENPTRRGKLPANIVQVAAAILAAGVEDDARDGALALVASGRVARESGSQADLIALLCQNGANADRAAHAAAAHGEFAAVHALLQHGARLDLPLAAALGRTEDFHRLMKSSSGDERHLALTLASQFGHAELVRALLDSGEDPNRFNPPNAHSHSTPLHQAALAGHLAVVEVLVEHGARTDLRDTIWNATPAEWAAHEGRTAVEAYLHRYPAK